jgi:hypothetical protein
MTHKEFTEFARQFCDGNQACRNYYREKEKPYSEEKTVGLERIRYTNTERIYEKWDGKRWNTLDSVKGLKEEFDTYEQNTLCDIQCKLESMVCAKLSKEKGCRYTNRITRTYDGGGGDTVGVIKVTFIDGSTEYARY